MKDSVISETIKALIAVVGVWLSKMTLQDWLAILTMLYILIQAAYLLRKWQREEQQGKARKRGSS